MTDQPIVEALGACPNGCGDLVQVHGADGSHVGYALSILRAVADGDSEFASLILRGTEQGELLRGCLEFTRSLAYAIVGDGANLSGVPHTDEQADAADAAAVSAYLSGLADSIALGFAARPLPVVARVARLLDDLAGHCYGETGTRINIHATSVDAAAAAAKILSDACERRFDLDLEGQAEAFREMMAEHA